MSTTSIDLVSDSSQHPINIFGRTARELLPPAAWTYLMSAAGDGQSAARNESAMQRLTLLPRVCRDVTRINLSSSLFGRRLEHPLVVAPAALHRFFHPDAEHATAAGAGRAGAPFTISMEGSVRWEDVDASNLWCQISPQQDTGVTKELLARAEAAGAWAVVLTLDTPVAGARHRQRRIMPELPSWLERPNLPQTANPRLAKGFTNAGFTWRELEEITASTTLPVIGKGILRPDDAKHALDAGVSAIGVSNHGGRNLDSAPATVSRLPYVVEAVDGRVPVLLDGGIRRGTDVVKALALGANAVMLARPILWGLAASGASGVTEVLEVLLTELEDAMALCGITEIAELDRSILFESDL